MSEGKGKKRDAPVKPFSSDEARSVGEKIGIDWDNAQFDVEQFRQAWMSSLSTELSVRQRT
jgi:hypothetical protein